jgi:hypothetical protein
MKIVKVSGKYDAKDETKEHIGMVKVFIDGVRSRLKERAANHDKTKLQSPEAEIFQEYTPKLKGTTYGSDEYKEFLKEMDVALSHHYEENSHHPEHYKKGLEDMNLLDVFEMLCDWKAATLRHNDGDIKKSIEINSKRFKIPAKLSKIMQNTVPILDDILKEHKKKGRMKKR